MPSLLLTVFVLQVTIHLINSFGVTAFNELAWLLYNKLPTPTSKAYAKGRTQRAEILKQKRELASISAQDDFARWARLRRQHDKATAAYDATAAALKDGKARFDRTLNGARWLATNGLRLVLQFWFARSPVFWLPRGALPGYAQWVLSFPKAPLGSVSIQVWGIACASVVTMVAELVGSLYVLWAGGAVEAGKVKGAPMAFPADHSSTADTKPKQRGKKEL